MLPHKQTKQQLCYHGGICVSCAQISRNIRFWAAHSRDWPQDSASNQRTREINLQTLNAVIMISLSTQKIAEHRTLPHMHSKLQLCFHIGICVGCAQISRDIRFLAAHTRDDTYIDTTKKQEQRLQRHVQNKLQCCHHGGIFVSCSQISCDLWAASLDAAHCAHMSLPTQGVGLSSLLITESNAKLTCTSPQQYLNGSALSKLNKFQTISHLRHVAHNIWNFWYPYLVANLLLWCLCPLQNDIYHPCFRFSILVC